MIVTEPPDLEVPRRDAWRSDISVTVAAGRTLQAGDAIAVPVFWVKVVFIVFDYVVFG